MQRMYKKVQWQHKDKVSQSWQRSTKQTSYRKNIFKLSCKESSGFLRRKFPRCQQTEKHMWSYQVLYDWEIIVVWKHWKERCEMEKNKHLSWGQELGKKWGKTTTRFKGNYALHQEKFSLDALGYFSKVFEYLQIR